MDLTGARLKLLPHRRVILLPIAPIKWRFIDNGAFPWPAGKKVFGDLAFDCAGLHLFDFVPFGAGEADAGEAFAAREDDAPAAVIPGVVLVLAQDGELDAVDGAEFLQREAEGLGDEDINFHEGLAAGVVRAQGA